MALGLAVLGLDHWYTAFGMTDTAAKSAVAPLVGVAELNPARIDSVRERITEAIVTDNAAELLKRDDVGIVAICASTDQAPALAKASLAAGKHVVCVKPSARTLAELDEVIAAAEASGKFFGSFEGMQRLTPRITLLRDLIQGGAIGVPMSYHQIGHGGLPQPWPGQTGDSWWLHKEQVPGGAWIDHAIYAIDLARFVFAGEVTAAVGVIENRIQTNLSLEDYGMALLKLKPNSGGASVSLMLEDTWTAMPGTGRHRVEFLGSAGYLQPEGNEWVVTRGSEETRHPIPESPFFRIDALVNLLESGSPLPFGPADARANLAACLAVYEKAM